MKSLGERLLSDQSPFLVQKLLDTIGQLEEVKKLRSGDLLIKVGSIKMSRKLEQLKNLGEFRVEVEPHKTLNFVKGVISHPDLAKSSSDEVVEHLKHLGVTDAYCVTKTIDGTKRKTGHIILTFRRAQLPAELKAGFLPCKVYPYIPNPMRCYKCQKFGHLSGFCKSRDTICATCGEKEHDEADCLNPPCCVNCKGEHPSNSRDCPTWKAEKEIQKIKINRDLSYKDAKKAYEVETAHSQPYAVVATAANEAGNDMIKQIMTKLTSLEKRLQQITTPQVIPSGSTPSQETPFQRIPPQETPPKGTPPKEDPLKGTPPKENPPKETPKGTPADKNKDRKRAGSVSPSSSTKRLETEHVQTMNNNIPLNPNLKTDRDKLSKQQKELNARIAKEKEDRRRRNNQKVDPRKRVTKP